MCGIAGVIETDAAAPARRGEVSRMLARLEHRGPDGAGIAGDRGGCLGHRRLAIIDLTEAGAQPIPNEDGTVWCSVNGEIYNHRDLRAGLEASGHRFRSRSDSEVVVHLYERHGPAFVERLEGMFALAVWDGNRRTLVLARDRMGKKPLYYHLTPARLAFASEIAALLASGLVEPQADPRAIDAYLAFRFVPAPATGFAGIAKLPPAGLLVWKGGAAQTSAYWSAPEPPAPAPRDGARGGRPSLPAADASAPAERLRSLFGAAVRRRLEADVPLGLLLSGGLDSSAIAVEMGRALGNGFMTFCAEFPEADYDEGPYAREVARIVGARHHALRVSADVAAALPRLTLHAGEPFGDSSILAVEALSRAVRPHATVVLSGDGGDEMLGGYDRYRALALSAGVGRGTVAALARPIASALGAIPGGARRRNLAGRAARFAEGLGLSPDERNAAWLACFDAPARRALLSADFAREVEGQEPMELLMSCLPASGDPIQRALHADRLVTLPGRMLHKLDAATMSCALEARCPFLDRQLVEWACGLPSSLLVGRRAGKLLLREAYRGELPASLLRRKKAGFGLPVDHWLRGPLRGMAADLLGGGRIARRGIFQPASVRRLLDEHLGGRRNHDDRLWSLLALEVWFRTFLDAPATPSRDPAETMEAGG